MSNIIDGITIFFIMAGVTCLLLIAFVYPDSLDLRFFALYTLGMAIFYQITTVKYNTTIPVPKFTKIPDTKPVYTETEKMIQQLEEG